ncbi:CDP-diacylglycerol--glycerol-3-phosphate 3-phosphatidyltransferase [Corynebacterium sp. 13CS0277]|uniref:CDP-diacylglycerol--glycerol-3-phosphate 3-phosphatidyltransferase n=1 Tax=Corynebacterium sp. 13CS0277 TaxID=2071994 RepID=UPI000D029ED3|nr:CDP-diacylglycerol--glycerol-3-phosphate 3-phosphatidyltransferase [Corynebacterium sp. 13CS0277]PRQ10537.1 CDP-diacylglycerol--glycerol-3-phosphate 3-phosphatidyltransferase [Corynebacterium sp. 13CS0277]
MSAQTSNLNLPNVLTSLRIVVIPLFAWCVLAADGGGGAWRWAAFVVFVALMITDKLDGDIARARGIVTTFGKIADPIADKALMITALVTLNLTGLLAWWVTVVIVIRELGITLWRMVLLRRGVVVPASKGGKVKTTLQALAVALLLLPHSDSLHGPFLWVMYAAVLVTVVTGLQYLWDSFRGTGAHDTTDPAGVETTTR